MRETGTVCQSLAVIANLWQAIRARKKRRQTLATTAADKNPPPPSRKCCRSLKSFAANRQGPPDLHGRRRVEAAPGAALWPAPEVLLALGGRLAALAALGL